MNILGIIATDVAGHPAAGLLRNGKLIAFAEEERFVRVKQARGYFPSRALAFCFRRAGLTIRDIDLIAFGWDAARYRCQFPLYLGLTFIRNKLSSNPLSLRSGKRPGFGAGIYDGINSLVSYQPGRIRERIILGLRDAGQDIDMVPPIVFVRHHLAHAATAFYCSGFPEAAILVFDGHGEENAITIYRGQDKEITLLKEINIPHSLGWFYSIFTEYLGWEPQEGEVKLMGLAPFGRPDAKIRDLVESILVISESGIKLDTRYTFYNGQRSYGKFFSDLLVEKLGPPRGKNQEISPVHKDIAFAVQKRLEEAGVFLAGLALEMAGSGNLCLAGGVALNCKMNGEIHKSGVADNLFVQPISYDAGVALGAAMVESIKGGEDCRFRLRHLAWGPEYSDQEIEAVLRRNRISYRKVDDVEARAAEEISRGRIVGWFQGRMEAGPRALGQRSILADPRDPGMKDRVNNLVKFREDWRPFAMSILDEYKDEYLRKAVPSPFMTQAFDIVEARLGDMESAIHWIDQTTRPQTVVRDVNPRYWQLIEEFRRLTGVPLVLNTSFNVKGEPIVCSPEDAIRAFFGTGMDILYLGNCVIAKTGDRPPLPPR